MFRITKYHLFWIIFWFLVLLWLLVDDMALSGKLSYQKDFSKNQFEISYLFPLGRTIMTDTGQTITGEPVYFTVYAPQRLDRARITIQFDNLPTGWSIGYQVAPGFNYQLVDFDGNNNTRTIDLNIRGAYYMNNRLRFILSHPDFSSSKNLTITAFSVKLTREHAFNLGDYFDVWKRNIKYAYQRVL